jgi:hypothetical protein
MCSSCEDGVFSEGGPNEHTCLATIHRGPPATNDRSVYKHVYTNHGEQVLAANPRSRVKRHGQERSVDGFDAYQAYRTTEL